MCHPAQFALDTGSLEQCGWGQQALVSLKVEQSIISPPQTPLKGCGVLVPPGHQVTSGCGRAKVVASNQLRELAEMC